jgi:hypothetical protein
MALVLEAVGALILVALVGGALYRGDTPGTEGEWHDELARIRAERHRYVWRDGRVTHTAGYEGRHRA